jgi:signal transduction histidine kinase
LSLDDFDESRFYGAFGKMKVVKSPPKTGFYCLPEKFFILDRELLVLMQVMDNLVSNTIKYSPHGKNVYVRLKASNEKVRVEIQDDGPGISEEDMKKLFGKFARLFARPTGGEHSTGLGLSIVKKNGGSNAGARVVRIGSG